MSVENNVRVVREPRSGLLAVVAPSVLVTFQSGCAGRDSYVLPGSNRDEPEDMAQRWYSYGRLEIGADVPDCYSLTRTSPSGALVPQARLQGNGGTCVREYRQHMLAIEAGDVPAFITRLGRAAAAADNDQLPAAERLLQATDRRRLRVGGEPIAACATYVVGATGVEINFVDRSGGWSIGMPASEGVATEADLQAAGSFAPLA